MQPAALVLLLLVVVLSLHASEAFLPGNRFLSSRLGSNVMSLHMSASGNWPLTSISEKQLMTLVSSAVADHVEDVKAEDVTLDANLIADYDADSVDIVSILMSLEANFKDKLKATGTTVPMQKLPSLSKVRDLFDLMVEVIKEVESKEKK